MNEFQERTVIALERIADALDKIAGVKANPDKQITGEGYATQVDWNDYTKNGLSSADSREGDNLTPYQPVDFLGMGFSTVELQGAASMQPKTINRLLVHQVFGNACEDEECQK